MRQDRVVALFAFKLMPRVRTMAGGDRTNLGGWLLPRRLQVIPQFSTPSAHVVFDELNEFSLYYLENTNKAYMLCGDLINDCLRRINIES